MELRFVKEIKWPKRQKDVFLEAKLSLQFLQQKQDVVLAKHRAEHIKLFLHRSFEQELVELTGDFFNSAIIVNVI